MQEKVKHLDTLENRLDSTKISLYRDFLQEYSYRTYKGNIDSESWGGVICFHRRWIK